VLTTKREKPGIIFITNFVNSSLLFSILRQQLFLEILIAPFSIDFLDFALCNQQTLQRKYWIDYLEREITRGTHLIPVKCTWKKVISILINVRWTTVLCFSCENSKFEFYTRRTLYVIHLTLILMEINFLPFRFTTN